MLELSLFMVSVPTVSQPFVYDWIFHIPSHSPSIAGLVNRIQVSFIWNVNVNQMVLNVVIISSKDTAMYSNPHTHPAVHITRSGLFVLDTVVQTDCRKPPVCR